MPFQFRSNRKYLYKRVLRTTMQQEQSQILACPIRMAEFSADHSVNGVLTVFHQHAVGLVLTKEQKHYAIEVLKKKFAEAERDYEMGLDVSLHPDSYWSSRDGTICSRMSTEGDDGMEFSDAEAEPVPIVVPPNPANPGPSGDADVSSSMSNDIFIRCICATMTCISDPMNIREPDATKWSTWPMYRKDVMWEVIGGLGIPLDTVRNWICNAPRTQIGSLQELLAVNQELMAGEVEAELP